MKLTTFLKKGFYFCFYVLVGVGGMSLCLDLGSARSPVTKNGKPINEGKRQKTWGLDLETSSELELDGG